MPLSIPTPKSVVASVAAYLRSDLPELDPSTSRRSYVAGMVKAFGLALADFYIALKRFADREPWPQTAVGNADGTGFLFTGWWTAVTHLTRNGAAPASGVAVFTGTNGAAVNVGLELTANNVTYAVTVGSSITVQPLLIDSLSYDSGTGIVSAIATNEHHFATGLTLTISGAGDAGYNGAVDITVTGAQTFTYAPLSEPASSPAVGTLMATGLFGVATVVATSNGIATNLDSGSSMSIASTPTGVDSAALVAWGGLAGGSDIETPEEYRARTLEVLATDFGMFSGGEIAIVAKQVPGVTRVIVREAQIDPDPGWPLEGQVRVAFFRDHDTSIYPSSQAVATVKDHIVASILPAHVAAEDVDVLALTPQPVNLTISSIVPDTPMMRLAVTNVARQWFAETAEWGATVDVAALKCAIAATYDIQSRQKLRSFVLTAPTTDVVMTDVDNIATLGAVTFG